MKEEKDKVEVNEERMYVKGKHIPILILLCLLFVVLAYVNENLGMLSLLVILFYVMAVAG